MASYRDQVRQKQATSAARAKQQGKNVDDIRKESRGLQATGAMVTRLMNESTLGGRRGNDPIVTP